MEGLEIKMFDFKKIAELSPDMLDANGNFTNAGVADLAYDMSAEAREAFLLRVCRELCSTFESRSQLILFFGKLISFHLLPQSARHVIIHSINIRTRTYIQT